MLQTICTLFWGRGNAPLFGWGHSCSINCWGKPLPLLSVLTSLLISSCYYRNLFCFKLYSFLQAFNKVHLAQYVHWLADQLHADAMQQVEVAMLGDPSSWLHQSVGIWLIILFWSTSDKSITSTTPHNCSKSFHWYTPSTTTCSSTHSWCHWWWTTRGHCDLQRSNSKKRRINPYSSRAFYFNVTFDT